jgi:very-short-patch-repair endonuclease
MVLHSVTIQHLAATHGGPFTVAMAEAVGVPRSAVDHELRVGRIEAMHPGVYRSAGTPVDRMVEIRAALLAAGPGAVVSHRTAAWLHEVASDEPSVIDITVTHDRRPRLERVRIHRTLRFPDAHRRQIDGLWVTSVDRTLADLGAAVRSARVRDAVETAVVARLTTVPRLFAFVDDHGRKGRNGIGALRLALEEWMLSERPPDSELEIAFARVVRREELPQPQYQFWVEVEGKRFRIDAAWPDVGLAVEVDGWESRNTRLAFQNDTDRQNAITLEGWMFIRFTWTDVVRRPGYVARRISQALALLGTESRR